MSLKATSVVICLLLFTASIFAEVPNSIDYQGRLADLAGNPIADNDYLVKFIIYDAPTAGTEHWNSGFQVVTTASGLFSYRLGSNVALPGGLFSDTNRYLGITVGTDDELSPRTRFTTTAYAFKAQQADVATDASTLGGAAPTYYLDWNNLSNMPAGFADGVDDGGTAYVAGSGLQLVETTFSIPAGGITNSHLAPSSVGSSEIINGSVGANEIATGSVGISEIATNGVGSAEISAGAVGSDEIATNAVGSSEIQTDAVAASEIAANAVGSSEIAANAVGSSEIANSAVGTLQIASGAVASSDIEDNTIRNWDIVDEPGVTNKTSTGQTGITSTTMQDIISTTITIPTTGYVFLIGKFYGLQSGTTGANVTHIQIDQTSGGSASYPHYVYIGHASYSSIGSHRFPGAVTRMYWLSAGSYTFRLEAAQSVGNAGSATSSIYASVLTAMFFPTSYGSVSTVMDDPGDDPFAKAVQIIDESGLTKDAFEVDLRNLELRAKEAELRAFEANQALLEAAAEKQ